MEEEKAQNLEEAQINDENIEEVVETETIEELDTAPLVKAQEWLKANQDNLKYLNPAKLQRLEIILNKPELVDAATLAEAETLFNVLEKDLKEKFNQNFNKVKSGLVNLREEMFQIPGYENLPGELQEVALNTFTNCELRLSNTNSIDALTEIFDNFENNVYPDLAGKIYALENPNVFPLNLTEVIDSMPRLDFSSIEELDNALAQVRDAAVQKLNKAKPKE